MTDGCAFEVFIPRWHPARVNQLLSGHWSKGHRLKKGDRQVIWASTLSLPKATGKRQIEMTIVLKPRQRAADPDSQWKSTLDALKHARMIVDDNRQGVELAPVRYERGTDREWGTRLRLIEIAV